MILLPLLGLLSSVQAAVTRAPATAQSANVLRYTVSVTTTEFARTAVQIWQSGTAVGTGWTTSYTASASRANSVAIWGLKPSTLYYYRVLVDPTLGANYTDTRVRSFTTAALPSNLPVLTATTYAGAPDFNYLIFDTYTTDVEDGAIMIVDDSATVVWYQTVPSSGQTYRAVWYSEEEQAVYAIIDLDRIVRYSMDGTVTLDWDRSTYIEDYIHHEVRMFDGILYALTCRSFTEGTATYIEDGIQGYDSAGNLVYEWWVIDDGGLDMTTNPPSSNPPVAAGFGVVFPNAVEWTHANAMQIREENGSLKAYISMRLLWQVAKVDMATGEVEWLMGQNNNAASRTSNDFTVDSSGVSTTWWSLQHDTHFEDDGTFVMFDNRYGNAASRALEVSIDESAMVATIDRALDFSDLVDTDFDGTCSHVSSASSTANGHMVMTCGTSRLVADYDGSDALQWTLEIGSTMVTYRAKPIDSIGN